MCMLFTCVFAIYVTCNFFVSTCLYLLFGRHRRVLRIFTHYTFIYFPTLNSRHPDHYWSVLSFPLCKSDGKLFICIESFLYNYFNTFDYFTELVRVYFLHFINCRVNCTVFASLCFLCLYCNFI